MKIITKKSVIFAALAVVLLVTALVISCNAPSLDGIFDKEEPSKPGTGKVRLLISNRNDSRTILPTGLPSNIKYWVTFSHGTEPYSISVSSGTINNVPARTYTGISVIVYTSATYLNTLTAVQGAAIGSGTYTGSTPIVIANGGTLNLTGDPITTTLYTPGVTVGSSVGTGTFSYNLDMTNISVGRLTAANIRIVSRPTPNPTDDPPQENLDITDYDSTTITGNVTGIPAGYYNVFFTLTDNASHTASFYQILHVYRNMTSTFTFSGFSDTLFPTHGGTSSIVIKDPDLPGDIEYSLAGVSNATVTNNTASDGGYLVEVNDGDTGVIRLTITSATGSPTILDWSYGLAISFGAAMDITSATTVTLTIDTSVSPFDSLPADIVTTVEFDFNGSDHSTVPITIRILE